MNRFRIIRISQFDKIQLDSYTLYQKYTPSHMSLYITGMNRHFSLSLSLCVRLLSDAVRGLEEDLNRS